MTSVRMPGTRLVVLLALLPLVGGASPAAAAGSASAWPDEGTVVLAREPDRPYRSLPLALDAAQDGDTLRIGPGRFEGSLVIRGKRLRLVGAGTGKTILTAPGTVFEVQADARVALLGVTLTSTPGEGFAPALLVRGDGFRLEECLVEGAAGFGIELRDARHDAELVANIVRTNRGGGVRLTSSTARLRANVIVDNGGAGVLLEGEPPADRRVVLEHDTIAHNFVQEVAVSVAVPGPLDGNVPAPLRRVLSFRFNVASGRLPEGLLATESLADLQRHNVLVWPRQVAGFFVDPDRGDYRPRAALPVDPYGIEMGARLSEEAARRLGPTIERALADGRVEQALALARRAPADRRKAFQDRARTALYARYVQYVETRQFGLAVRDFFLATHAAPAEWNVNDRFRQAVDRIGKAYATAVDWSGLFAGDVELRGLLEKAIAEGQTRPGRPGASGEGPQWTVAGRLTKDVLIDHESTSIEKTLTIANPEAGDVASTLAIARTRRQRTDADRRKIAEEVEILLGASDGARTTYIRAKERELERLSQRVLAIDRRIRTLEETGTRVRAQFSFELHASDERTTARGEVAVRITDPVGREEKETISLQEEERFLSVQPVTALAYAGIAPRTIDDTLERRTFVERLLRQTIVTAVGALERRDLDRVTALLAATLTESATDADENELFELLTTYALRFRDALAAQADFRALEKVRDGLPELDEPHFALVYDRGLRRSLPVRLEVETGAERKRAERGAAELKRRFGAYWALLADLRSLFEHLGGRPLEAFLDQAAAAR